MGSVRDCGRSCADCGVGALARQILGSAILAVGDARCSEAEFAQEMKENERKVFFSRDSEGAFGVETSQTPKTPQTPQTPQTLQTPQTTQPFKPLEPGQWFCHTGRFKPLELCQWFCRTGRWRRSKTSHLLDCGPWARKGIKVFCYRDSEGAFGIESATMRGSFWTRIRWGKAVAAAGVRGQDVRKKGKKSLFCHTGRFKPLKPLKPLEPCQWFCQTGRWRRSKTSHLLHCGPWALCAGRRRRSKTSHLLPTLETPRTWPMVLPYWSLQTPQTPQTLRTLPMVLPDWPLETLQNLALARLWARGSVRDCGRSRADEVYLAGAGFVNVPFP